MSGSKKTLAIVQWGSYRAFPVGGISSFLESIIPHLGRAFDLKLIGMSLGEPLGRWTKITLAGGSYSFLPVVTAQPSKVVPDRIRLALAIARYRREVFGSGADAFYVHMTEAAFPLIAFGDVPVVVHVHGLYNLFRFSRHMLGMPFAWVYDSLYPQLFSRCAKVLGAGTNDEFEAFRERMKARSGSAVPTCVRENVFYRQPRDEARRKLGIGTQETVVLYVGRLTETKNPALLVQAAKLLRSEIPTLRVVFVGDGPLRSSIQNANFPGLISTGALSPETTALWMNAADALAVVSRTEAFTSIAALEALSCGIPVVATPVSALPEFIRQGVNGALSLDFTPSNFAAALKTVLNDPPSVSSCQRSVEAYTAPKVAARVVQELNAVLCRNISSGVAAD